MFIKYIYITKLTEQFKSQFKRTQRIILAPLVQFMNFIFAILIYVLEQVHFLKKDHDFI